LSVDVSSGQTNAALGEAKEILQAMLDMCLNNGKYIAEQTLTAPHEGQAGSGKAQAPREGSHFLPKGLWYR
jgi:hypothetical protein